MELKGSSSHFCGMETTIQRGANQEVVERHIRNICRALGFKQSDCSTDFVEPPGENFNLRSQIISIKMRLNEASKASLRELKDEAARISKFAGALSHMSPAGVKVVFRFGGEVFDATASREKTIFEKGSESSQRKPALKNTL